MRKFQQIFFDLDGTIFDFYQCEIIALEKTFYAFSLNFNKAILEKYLNINSNLWKKHEKGEITQADLLVYRFEVLFKNLGICISPDKASDEYQNCLSREIFFEENALYILQKLYQDYDLYIMTNGKTSTQTQRIKKAGIAQYFKDIFISEEVGYNKPQKEFFTTCFQRIGLKNKENAIIVGDSLTSDILGGNNAQIITCWYNPKAEKAATHISYDYEISSLIQLLDILQENANGC